MVATPGTLLNVATRLVVTRANAPPAFQQPPIVVENITGEGLRMEWTVKKAIGPSVDQAEVRVFNLAPNHRLNISILAGLGYPMAVELYVGWAEIPELLFSGTVWKLRPERRTGTDIISSFEAGAGALEMRNTPPGGGAWVGSAVTLVLAKLISDLGLPPPGGATKALIAKRAAALPVKAWQHVYTDPPHEQLDTLMATLGLTWGNENMFFVVYEKGLRNDVLPAILTPVSGLLSWEEQDEGAVVFEALAQPRVAPGVQVNIADQFGKVIGGGPLRVTEIEFRGSTDGESSMVGTARKVELLGA